MDNIAAIVSERQRQFNLPGTESDVTKSPNDWIVTVASLLCEAQERSGICPSAEEFKHAMIKAGAVVLAALEHVELMQSNGKLK